MHISNLLVTGQEVRPNRDKVYKVALGEQTIFEIGQAIPWICVGTGCLGIVQVFEFHVTQYGTTVFFTPLVMGSPSDKLNRSLYQYYRMATGDTTDGGRVESDTKKTGVDSATRMLLGETRSAREIGRDAHRGYDDYDEDDDDGDGIFDMLRKSNPDDPLFR